VHITSWPEFGHKKKSKEKKWRQTCFKLHWNSHESADDSQLPSVFSWWSAMNVTVVEVMGEVRVHKYSIEGQGSQHTDRQQQTATTTLSSDTAMLTQSTYQRSSNLGHGGNFTIPINGWDCCLSCCGLRLQYISKQHLGSYARSYQISFLCRTFVSWKSCIKCKNQQKPVLP